MKIDPPKVTEDLRLLALYREELMHSEAEPAFDALTHAAALICGTPIALVSLVDGKRQWFKSAVGLEQGSETPREQAFCAHAIQQPTQIFEVQDALADSRFAGNPLVTGDPKIRFYAGMPIKSVDGQPLGTICVIDQSPGALSERQRHALREIAAGIEALILSRRHYQEGTRRMSRFYEMTPAELILLDSNDSIIEVSERWLEPLGYRRSFILGKNIRNFMTVESRKNYLRIRDQVWSVGEWRDVPVQLRTNSGDIICRRMSGTVERSPGNDVVRASCAFTEAASQLTESPEATLSGL